MASSRVVVQVCSPPCESTLHASDRRRRLSVHSSALRRVACRTVMEFVSCPRIDGVAQRLRAARLRQAPGGLASLAPLEPPPAPTASPRLKTAAVLRRRVS